MAGEVPGLVVRQMLNSFGAAGIDVDEAIAGLGFRREDVARPFFRGDWDDLVAILKRVFAKYPRDVLVRAAQDFGATEPFARLAAQRVFFLPALYRFVLQGTSWMFPTLAMTYHRLPDGRIEWGVALLSGQGCREFFELAAPTVAALPRQLALPLATVEADISDRHGVYRIQLPLTARSEPEADEEVDVNTSIRAWKQMAADAGGVVPPTGLERDLEIVTRIEAVRRAWQLTPRQSEVLALLVRGEGNKSISASLGCSVRTAEAHVGTLLEKAHCASRTEVVAAFWRPKT
jgi:DNA-binding CsgD family transcriptional regulator